MTMESARAHPYMANSTAAAREHMLRAIGVADVEELFEQVPIDHRTERPILLPPPLDSEVALKRHLNTVLSNNLDCERHLSFLGGGVWQHHVPAVCDEIWSRSEFLTSVWGTPSSDLGRNQAWFEYASQLGELVAMDFVGLPVYSWGAAVGHSIRMAARITGRSQVLVPSHMDPQRKAVAVTYAGSPELRGHIELIDLALDPDTGRLDLEDLEQKLNVGVAAVYLENPSYLGIVEDQGPQIASMARENGSEFIVGVDPSSLGVLEPPARYGADITIGTTQPLGVHMNGGGGVGGFIATRDEEKYASQYPTLQVSLAPTVVPGELGFGLTLFEQSSYGSREEGNDWTGNSVYLWAIANAAYMSLLGPAGFHELGETILQMSHYAARRIGDVRDLSIKWPRGFFKEFVVQFDSTGRSVSEVNAELLSMGIFGGIDLSALPGMGESALYCVTEVHNRADIDRLVNALAEVTSR